MCCSTGRGYLTHRIAGGALIHTMGDACRQQGRAVLQRLFMFVHDRWSQGTTVAQVFVQSCVKQ